MRLVTYQSKEVANILKEGKEYVADYSKSGFEYQEQYEKLSEFLGLSNCPIFCIPLNKEELYQSERISGYRGGKGNTVRIELNVPNSECHVTEFYEWVDFIYFTTQEDDKGLQFTKEESLEHPEAYMMDYGSNCADIRYPQVILNRIKPGWITNELQENIDASEISSNKFDIVKRDFPRHDGAEMYDILITDKEIISKVVEIYRGICTKMEELNEVDCNKPITVKVLDKTCKLCLKDGHQWKAVGIHIYPEVEEYLIKALDLKDETDLYRTCNIIDEDISMDDIAPIEHGKYKINYVGNFWAVNISDIDTKKKIVSIIQKELETMLNNNAFVQDTYKIKLNNVDYSKSFLFSDDDPRSLWLHLTDKGVEELGQDNVFSDTEDPDFVDLYLTKDCVSKIIDYLGVADSYSDFVRGKIRQLDENINPEDLGDNIKWEVVSKQDLKYIQVFDNKLKHDIIDVIIQNKDRCTIAGDTVEDYMLETIDYNASFVLYVSSFVGGCISEIWAETTNEDILPISIDRIIGARGIEVSNQLIKLFGADCVKDLFGQELDEAINIDDVDDSEQYGLIEPVRGTFSSESKYNIIVTSKRLKDKLAPLIEDALVRSHVEYMLPVDTTKDIAFDGGCLSGNNVILMCYFHPVDSSSQKLGRDWVLIAFEDIVEEIAQVLGFDSPEDMIKDVRQVNEDINLSDIDEVPWTVDNSTGFVLIYSKHLKDKILNTIQEADKIDFTFVPDSYLPFYIAYDIKPDGTDLPINLKCVLIKDLNKKTRVLGLSDKTSNEIKKLLKPSDVSEGIESDLIDSNRKFKVIEDEYGFNEIVIDDAETVKTICKVIGFTQEQPRYFKIVDCVPSNDYKIIYSIELAWPYDSYNIDDICTLERDMAEDVLGVIEVSDEEVIDILSVEVEDSIDESIDEDDIEDDMLLDKGETFDFDGTGEYGRYNTSNDECLVLCNEVGFTNIDSIVESSLYRCDEADLMWFEIITNENDSWQFEVSEEMLNKASITKEDIPNRRIEVIRHILSRIKRLNK